MKLRFSEARFAWTRRSTSMQIYVSEGDCASKWLHACLRGTIVAAAAFRYKNSFGLDWLTHMQFNAVDDFARNGIEYLQATVSRRVR